jgi:thiamine biosynthesis protein ThiI
MDLGREAGSAIFLSNNDIKVDLTDPDVTFYVEVRNNKAYIVHEYLPGPGGLPLGCQGKVVAVVDDERGVLSAWMMMKRGCRAFVHGSYDMSLLRRYDPSLRTIEKGDTVNGILGKVLGTPLDGLDPAVLSDVPVYFPTIGMNDAEVKEMLRSIH